MQAYPRLTYVRDTVQKRTHDEARHGKTFKRLPERYFKYSNT